MLRNYSRVHNPDLKGSQKRVMTGILPETEISRDTYTIDIDKNAISIGDSELYSALGYPEQGPPPEMAAVIQDVKKGIPGLCELKAGYCIRPFDADGRQPDGMSIEGTFLKMQKIITGQIKKSGSAAIFICTIGPGPEKWSKELIKDGDPALGYIVDSAASVLAEEIAGIVHRHIETKMAGIGIRTTNRFSPGYCGWDVAEQRKLFSFFPDNFCGISLSDSAFMEPRKSISGIVGTGKHVKHAEYMCRHCSEEHCIYRFTQQKNNRGKT